MKHQIRQFIGAGAALVVVLALVLPGTAAAQTTTARLQGVVRDASGPLPGATVKAVNPETTLTRSSVTGADGVYTLVLPPGTYRVSAATGAHEEQRATLSLAVGQSLEYNFDLKPGKMVSQAMTVSAEASFEPEVRTTEIATNVSQEQMKSLPQPTRNFLNFAVLAPGVRLSHDEFRQEIAYGAQGSMNTNVFIDGASFKNDVLLGGNVGQDSSRGNPFPQNAVQEYRVITQNYKAEYQKASSVIISAITKSGTNEFHGDLFTYYQNQNLVAQDPYSKARGEPKPEYTRWQPGFSFGGPIAKDRVFFFGSWEANYQNRDYSVFMNPNQLWPSSFQSQFTKYNGQYLSKFRSNLGFGKFSFLLSEGSTIDVSGDYRSETDIRDFGNQVSYESAANIKNSVGSARAKWSAVFGMNLNEAMLAWQQYKWNPTPETPDLVGQNYEQLMRVGGKDTYQDFTQSRYSVRDDFTMMNLQWNGDHTVKAGITYDYLKYHVVKTLYGNPVYNYRYNTYISTPGDMPYNAQYGVGNPDLSANNSQFGIYAQDDWRINSRLTAYLGLRWDFETDELNNDYVTPANIRAGLSKVYPANYFTDGTQRPVFYGAIQPRLGLSYDLSGDGKTTAYAGWGIYYDRTLYNDILDEKYRQQYGIRTFWFSKDGSPQDGNPAIKWDPSYLTKAGLDTLIAKGIAPTPEIFLLNNEQKPPSTQQWSVGARHNFGAFIASLGYMGVYGKNQLTWTCGIKNPDGTCNWGARPDPTLGFSMLSRGKESWYNSVQVAFEKPFTVSSKWGGTVSYTWSDAKQTGNDLFSWGTLDPVNGNKQRSNIAQEHQIVLTGTVALPADFRFSTLVNLGSGYPFYTTDCTAGWDKCVEKIGGGDPPKWNESIDLRLDWSVALGSAARLGLNVAVINVFNYINQQGYDGFSPPLPDVNSNYGKPNSAYNPRRVEFGVTFGF